ncbi:MAG: HEAT repeat domain-containing protein [Anaerolineae bacterium]
MSAEKTKAQKLAHLEHIATSEERFFFDYSPHIQEYLKDEQAEVRARAVECLWEYPEPAHIDTLINLTENDPSNEVREKAISGLGRFIYEGEMADYDFDFGPYDAVLREGELPQADFQRVYDYLLAIIRDESRPLDARRRAIEAISFSHEPEILDIIAQAYHHTETKMRVSAVFAMGRNGNIRFEGPILEALYSPIPDIEFEAVRAAGAFPLDRANRQLMRIAEADEDKDLRLTAIWSLGEIGHEMTFLLLNDLQSDPDKDIREAAEAALEEWIMSVHLRELDDDDFLGEEDADDLDWDYFDQDNNGQII